MGGPTIADSQKTKGKSMNRTKHQVNMPSGAGLFIRPSTINQPVPTKPQTRESATYQPGISDSCEVSVAHKPPSPSPIHPNILVP